MKIETLAKEINKSSSFKKHVQLEEAPYRKGFYTLQRTCTCVEEHCVVLSEKIRRIFGFESPKIQIKNGGIVISAQRSVVANRPAALSRAIPDQMYVYTDICEPRTVGDTQAALLRIVSVDTSKYKFDSNVVRHFAPAHYIPLLHHNFRSIVIDIRDQHGSRIPFEYGTLTITLHFRRDH